MIFGNWDKIKYIVAYWLSGNNSFRGISISDLTRNWCSHPVSLNVCIRMKGFLIPYLLSLKNSNIHGSARHLIFLVFAYGYQDVKAVGEILMSFTFGLK